MRPGACALACTCLVLAFGCASSQKPGADLAVRPAPPETEAEPDAEPPEHQGEPVALSIVTPAPALSYDIRRTLRRPPRVAGDLDVRPRRQWRYIVIHHSASEAGSEAAFDAAHKALGWRGVGYDFVIGNGNGSPDGLVEVTFRWEQQQDGAHAGVAEFNKHGIGICLVGNFDRSYPTARQMEALVGLINFLQERCRIPTANIMGHRHVKPTRCPGANFPWYELFSLLNH
jgi:N-acetylmuramoyl-L-alanine amidase